jgi:F-box/leucine-rich repeat protein 10/11
VGDNITVSPLQAREKQSQPYHHGFGEQKTNGDVQSHTSNEVAANGPVQTDGPFDSPMPGTNAYVNANIPMAMNGVPMFGDVAKRGRSKACFECRKSKVSIPYFATHRHLAHVLILRAEEMHSR